MRSCPICSREHAENLYRCACGYQRLKEGREEDRLFEIYKYTKAVFTGRATLPPSPLDLREQDGVIHVEEALEDRYAICRIAPDTAQPTVAEPGLLAFRPSVCSLIVNVDELHALMLDESNVCILFLGERVRRIEGGNLRLLSRVRYLEVATDNPCFAADDHVLFDKERRVLLNYARMKPETEYRVPPTVRQIFVSAFDDCESLKTLYLPRHARLLYTTPDHLTALQARIRIRYVD